MLLSEIQRVSAEDAASPRHIRDNIRLGLNVKRARFCQIGDVVVSMGESGREQFFIFAKDRIAYGAAVLQRASLAGEDGFYVTEIGLLDELRYAGVGLAFYLALIDRGYTLFSGAMQTADSERVWRKLMRDPAVSMRTIRLLDATEEPADADAWSDESLRLIARKAMV